MRVCVCVAAYIVCKPAFTHFIHKIPAHLHRECDNNKRQVEYDTGQKLKDGDQWTSGFWHIQSSVD